MEARDTSTSRMMMRQQEKGDRVHPLTHENIRYQEFARFRQRYLVMHCPFSTFGRNKEKKHCMKQKVKRWLNNTMQQKKQEEAKDIQNSTNDESNNKSSSSSSSSNSHGYFGVTVPRFIMCVGANCINVHRHQLGKSSTVYPI